MNDDLKFAIGHVEEWREAKRRGFTNVPSEWQLDLIARALASKAQEAADEEDLHSRYVDALAELVRLRLRLGDDPHGPIGAEGSTR